MNRRTFVFSMAAFPLVATRVAISAPSVSARGQGAIGDGSSDDTAAFKRAFSAARGGTLVIERGRYTLNAPFEISNFTGRILCEDGVLIEFANPAKSGIVFKGGSDIAIEKMVLRWRATPRRRTGSGGALVFWRSKNVSIKQVTVQNSYNVGILFDECISPRVERVTVSSTTADGIHFANCQDPYVGTAVISDTGDDGLAFVNYEKKPDNKGGIAKDITVSRSRARGISIVGQSKVTVDGFSVSQTASSGVYVSFETSYQTRVPDAVWVGNGSISKAGTFAPQVGNQFGIEINQTKGVTLINIEISDSFYRGISILAPNGSIYMERIRILNPKSGTGLNASVKKLVVRGIRTEETRDAGIYVGDASYVEIQDAVIVNAAQDSPLNRAIALERVADARVDRLQVVANKAIDGQIIGLYSVKKGYIHGIRYLNPSKKSPRIERIAAGSVDVEAPSELAPAGTPTGLGVKK